MEPDRWSAVNPEKVPVRLAELGTPEPILQQAVDAGLHAAAGATGHHPVNYAGFLCWGDAIRELRDQLVPRGWMPGDTRGFPTVIHPSGRHQLAVAAGTRETGRGTDIPRTRRPKGIVTQLAIADNQISLDPEVFGDAADPAPQTWFLLHYSDLVADEVRLELSLPGAMFNGQVTGWLERLILKPLPGMAVLVMPEDPPPHSPIDIDIQRR
jgi:hypothetical protein